MTRAVRGKAAAVPTGGLVPLTEVVRSGRREALHLGVAVVSDADGTILRAAGDVELGSYLRSAAKPVQLEAMLAAGLESRTALAAEELAVCAASHGGEPGHVALVRSLLERGGIDESLLRCGPLEPLDAAAAASLLRAGLTPLPVHNNCSGKHTAMLLTARANGWDEERYLEPDHPLQRRILGRVSELAGVEPGVGVDGCGVPTYYLPLAAAAAMIARLLVLAARGGNAARVLGAMVAHPWYTSGSRRLAYRLMAAVPGLVAKEGAEGLFVVGVPAERSPWRRPVAVAVKALDGGGESARGREPAVARALLGLGVASGVEVTRLEALAEVPLLNAAGRRVGVVRGVLAL